MDAGAVTGSLWRVDGLVGTLLATGSFTAQTEHGWQDLIFGTPVAITPETTYTASYHAPSGDYAFEYGYPFPNTVGPIKALGGGVNGTYEYCSPGPCFPAASVGTNYWVTPRWVVPYGFEGFYSPVDNEALNVAKAGQSIPLKFRVTDGESGGPVTDLTTPPLTVSSKGAACGSSDLPTDAIETYAGGSGLQYLGDGYYQFNWKTLKSYKGHCRTMTLSLGDGNEYTAEFQFT